MSFSYSSAYSKKQTPQSQPIPYSNQVQNSAGGYAFTITDEQRLDRFLLLGADGPTYYASAQKLSRENAECVLRCLKTDGPKTVARITEISDSGRAPKNSPAIFALALAAAVGDPATKKAALTALPKVCRIGTHIFEFVEYVQGLRGWGRSLRRAVANWYLDKDTERLTYQLLKYQQRNGWSHRDLLRLSHPKPADETKKAAFYWATKGWEVVGEDPHPEKALQQLWAMERLKSVSDIGKAAELIREYRLPREAVPSELLKSPEIWLALLPDMPATALLRNLGTLSRVGLFADPENEQLVLSKLASTEWLRRSRIHPIAVLSALRTYESGHGVRSAASWPVSQPIVEALDRAFYTCFANVEPTGKRFLLALDVSGSMGGGEIAGVPGLTPREASAALALVTASVEPHCDIVGFTAPHGGSWWTSRSSRSQDVDGIKPLDIKSGQRLTEAIKAIARLEFGATDCALPMLYAIQNKLSYDCFVVFTDSETWAGEIHPVQALRQYRERRSIPAKLVVVGLTATQFSIADPDEVGMLDVVGGDAALPQLLAGFARE